MERVDLDDCKVLDKRLQCHSYDTNDDNVPNSEDVDVGNSAASHLRIEEPDMDIATEPVLFQWKSPVSLLVRQILPLWTFFSMQLERPLI
jgi:hypothetical protein